MKNKFLWSFLFLVFSGSALAQFANATFWKRRQAILRFTTSPQSVSRLNCSDMVTVQAINASSLAANQATDLTVNLSAPGLTFYLDANCSTEVSSVIIPAGNSSTNFYFVASGIGTSVLTASAAPYKDAEQTETSSANNYIWTGGGADSNWNTALNWSGGAAPTGGTAVVFDGTCVSNCSPNITANTSVLGMRVLTGYTGTITQNASVTFTLGSKGWFHQVGTFIGGNSTVTVYGPLTVAGGTYTSTSSTTFLGSNFLITGGAFTASATYIFGGRGNISVGTVPFNNIMFDPVNGATYVLNGTLFINGQLTLNNTTNNVTLLGGIIDLKGNLIVTNSGMPGTTEIKLTGTGTQKIDASAANTNRNLPSITIASSGPIELLGNLNLTGNYIYMSSGPLTAGTSFLNFVSSTTAQTATFGPHDYYDIGWRSNRNLTITSDVKVTNSLTLEATLTNAGYVAGPGNVLLSGNLIIKDHGVGQYGDLVVKFIGNNVQSVSVTSSFARSPGFVIDTTGTVNFPGSFNFHHGFKYIAGSVTGLTTTSFTGISGALHYIEAGSYTFGDVTFSGSNGNYYTIIGTMNISGRVDFNSTNNSILAGNINLGGNVTYTNFYRNNSNITFNGTVDQTITQIGSSQDGDIAINKSGGTVRMLTTMDWKFCPLVITNGSLDMNGQTLFLESASLNGNTITKNGGVLNVGGATVGNGAFYGGTIAP